MTDDDGYALAAQDALEHLDMGGGSVLSLEVTGRESNGAVTVLTGVVESGGPPLQVHLAEDEVVVRTRASSPTRSASSAGRCHPATWCGSGAASLTPSRTWVERLRAS